MLSSSPGVSPVTGGPDRPLLVAGAPRTGTTWIAEVLSRAPQVAWINEPDNEGPNAFALRAKRRLGRFPALRADDPAPRPYEKLWERALAGFEGSPVRQRLVWLLYEEDRTTAELWRAMCDHANPRLSWRLRLLTWTAAAPSERAGADRLLVKSVHAPLALEWVAARFRPRVMVVVRHPLNVIASWLELGWGGCALDTNPAVRSRFAKRWGLPDLGPAPSALERVAWEVGLFTCALRSGLDEHDDWIEASHEALCREPSTEFRRLYDRAGLLWTERADEHLEASNRPGTGFSTLRVAAHQPDSWRRRLAPDVVRQAWKVLSRIEAPWVERLASELD
jgi:hypothetical protein